tara:strand:+ start:5403 stop:5765 length:363 start_codon:yes stop_codon:yes gene_type:complete
MTDKPRIKCQWLEKDQILVNPDGQVLPCCYLGNTNFLNKHDETQRNSWRYGGVDGTKFNDVLLKYLKNKKDYNLNNKTMDEILSSDWFNIDLPNSWESYDTIPHACSTFCDGFQKDNEAE